MIEIVREITTHMRRKQEKQADALDQEWIAYAWCVIGAFSLHKRIDQGNPELRSKKDVFAQIALEYIQTGQGIKPFTKEELETLQTIFTRTMDIENLKPVAVKLGLRRQECRTLFIQAIRIIEANAITCK